MLHAPLPGIEIDISSACNCLQEQVAEGIEQQGDVADDGTASNDENSDTNTRNLAVSKGSRWFEQRETQRDL